MATMVTQTRLDVAVQNTAYLFLVLRPKVHTDNTHCDSFFERHTQLHALFTQRF
jgi:hypothetical protein